MDEQRACTPVPVDSGAFNPQCVLPYGLTVDHIRQAMGDFTEFLGFINTQLHAREMDRLETLLMAANFSSLVGEFMHKAITKYCSTLVKNRHHNGHPDLIPTGTYESDAVLHGTDGIEIKASRFRSGWQGHNAERVWLLVFVFNSNRPNDQEPRPFRFVQVLGAQLERSDWSESGRSATSRRTPTATVLKSGHQKMADNWIYSEQG